MDRAVERLDEIEARAAAATKGPWHWAGNTDTGEPYLATWIPGAGRCQVLAIGHDERSTTGPAADALRRSAEEFGYDPEDTVEQWATDGFGEPYKEPRLWLYTDLMAVNARNLAIYEVAPEATTREDPKVYRADVTGIRHPDAEFIAAARTDVPALVAALRACLAVHAAHVAPLVRAGRDTNQCRCTACDMARAITAALHPKGTDDD